MRRAVVTVAIVISGCSLDAGGTASTVEPFDATIEEGVAETAIERDTDIFVAEDTSVDTSVIDTSTPVDTAMPDTADAGCPAAKGGAKLCDEITAREALATMQVLDGKPDDFCDVPYVDFDNTKGAIRSPAMISGPAAATTRIRVAWSSFGIHAHLAVKDANILPRMPASDELVFLGDSIEIYIAGRDTLNGEFNGTAKDVGAHQIVFSAPDGTVASRATYFYMGKTSGSPPSSLWFARKTAMGYEIELRIPWADLKPGSTPAAGKRIALTWAVNNKYDGANPQAWSVFQVKSPYPMTSTCSDGEPQPYCDDRLWCTPALL